MFRGTPPVATGSSVCSGSGTIPPQTTMCNGFTWLLASFPGLILRRVQASRAGAEDQIGLSLFVNLRAVPQTCAAVDTLLAVEHRQTVAIRCDRLPRTHLDADALLAFAANLRVAKAYMIPKSSRSLHLAAHQQRILQRDQQLPVVRNIGPAAASHHCVVQWNIAELAILAQHTQRAGTHLPAAKLLEAADAPSPPRRKRQMQPPTRHSRHNHARHATQESALEPVARMLGGALLPFQPAPAPALYVRALQILPGECPSLLPEFDHSPGQKNPGEPGFVHTRSRENVGRPRALTDARAAIERQK